MENLGGIQFPIFNPFRASARFGSKQKLAERGGFEPPIRLLTVYRFSKPAPSATRPSLHHQSVAVFGSPVPQRARNLSVFSDSKASSPPAKLPQTVAESGLGIGPASSSETAPGCVARDFVNAGARIQARRYLDYAELPRKLQACQTSYVGASSGRA